MTTICILVGIVPPEKKIWEELVGGQDTTELLPSYDKKKKGVPVDWRDATIVDDEGVPTLVVECITSGSPDAIIQLIQSRFQKYENGQTGDKNENISFSCELWASAPAPIPLQPSIGYDNVLQWRGDDDDTAKWIDWATVTMKKWGVLVQEKVLDKDQITQLSSYVNKAILETESAIKTHRPEIEIGKDSFCYKEIASRNQQRFDLRLTSSEVTTFVEGYILNHSNVSLLLEQVLGTKAEIDFDISVVYSRPNARVQGWHADGSHQKGANDAGWDVNGWESQLSDTYAICLFLPLVDLDHEVGFTQFWPASHRSRNFVGFGPVAEITKSTFDGICKGGDCVWYDYRLLHRGMPNNSDRTTRPILQVIFKKKWYIEKANYGTESIRKEKALEQ